ncbi:hypothetical protein C8Q80DRAFT_1095154 [Daedaleopsis nitida]|nr:hypothetical protein C8Q80DRAFT_1095154 [Daedaleopsis nitida]
MACQSLVSTLFFSDSLLDHPTNPDSPIREATIAFHRSPSLTSIPTLTQIHSAANDQRRLSSLPRSDSGSYNGQRRERGEANFRDFAAHQNPFSPRSFATALPTSSGPESSPTADALFTSGPVGEPVLLFRPQPSSPLPNDMYNPRHPPHLSEVAADAFAEVTSRSALIPGASDSPPHPPPSDSEDIRHSNFSQSGIVHLPPLESAPGSQCSSGAPSTGRRNSPPFLSHSRSGRGSADARPWNVQSKSETSDGVRDFDARGLSTDGSRSSSGHPSSFSASPSNSGASGPHMTLRYQHVEDANGHHVILGREGELARCEDEPIRTPGAVQGFGILVAVDEDMETGNLVVRQVSENSTELLGLSPKYLFNLECFSQTLPDSQADILFDNIQYLSDTSMSAEEQAENLHVFMLSGYGEPGSSLPEDLNIQDPQGRRTWTCWCAAHRPMTASDVAANEGGSSPEREAGYQNIIILEFELERDVFNPLYPPPTLASDASSGVSSPSTDASHSASASNSSGRTLVSQSSSSEDSTSVVTPDDSTPSVGGDLTADSSLSTGPLSVLSPAPSHLSQVHSLPGEDDWMPSAEDVLESTTSRSKPLLALERLRHTRRPGGDTATPDSQGSVGGRSAQAGRAARRRRGTGSVGMMDVFAVMAQINEQLGAAPDLDTFLKVTVGVMKDLTQFHRVLMYQFDEAWNGQTVAELVDWNQTHDLYRGLHFPATDIPAQARELYVLNKVRLLYDRGQPTARLVVRSKEDLDKPLDMTHCYLRAMSPIHMKYLENMGVRASMSVSIVAFGTLWGLVACHSYGPHGMRVSFPVRQMLRLLSQSISRNIERLSYAQRLHTRKLINTMPTDQHPSGYIVSNADDLLGLFDADHGVLVIGEGAKILGPNQHGQEILIVAEYLRLKQFNTLQVSQAVTIDYPDLKLNTGLEIIAGLLYVPLSAGGRDFIAFLRKGQPRQVNWAGRPYKTAEGASVLEPRQSFRAWSEVVAGRCRAWTDEHLETAGVLALVYGKFIEVWRQKESALQTTKLTNILLSNASHEVRTPLNHIINYLELAMNGPLDKETMENLSHSHAASKSLLFTINDLLDLTRLESGNETSFNEPFDLFVAIEDATQLYRNEAHRRGIVFTLDLNNCPRQVVGDSRKIRTVVANLTANALKFTKDGNISVTCRYFDEPLGLRDSGDIAVEIVVADTGCGIATDKLESIFREFEQVESAPPRTHSPGLGLGLAVVARIVEQLGGQLRVDSAPGKGSRFSFLLPLTTEMSGSGSAGRLSISTPASSQSLVRSMRAVSQGNSRGLEIDNLVEALSSSHIQVEDGAVAGPGAVASRASNSPVSRPDSGGVGIPGSANPIKPVKMDGFDLDKPLRTRPSHSRMSSSKSRTVADVPKLRVLIVEDNDINRMILAKRLTLDGHTVVNTTNGQEGLEMIESDPNFDCILMDIQMPLLNGYEATERIRSLEKGKELADRLSHQHNGRIPIFAVSASLFENQREELHKLGMDGWILKPIDFKRLRVLLRGVVDPLQREKDVYSPGCSWEIGGWLSMPEARAPALGGGDSS